MRFIDLHCDTLVKFPEPVLGNSTGHLSLEKMQEAGALAQFFAIFFPAPENRILFGQVEPDPWAYYQHYYHIFCREMEKYSGHIALARNGTEMDKHKAEGKISAFLAMEGADALNTVPNEAMKRLEILYSQGLRLITLTWNQENALAYPNSRQADLMAQGLEDFGKEALHRMNDLGILVDVSHLSDGGFYDVARHASRPFVASHSCARALCNHPRCLSDNMLRILGDSGGVVGINFHAAFLQENSTHSTIDDIIRHLKYMEQLAGVDALALGSDFDGIDCELEIGDYLGLPLLAQALEKHFSPNQVEKICWGNAKRIINDVMG